MGREVRGLSAIKVLQICSYYVGSKLYHNLFSSLNKLDVEQDVYVFTHEGCLLSEDLRKDNVLFAPCYKRYQRPFFHLKHKRVYDDIRTRVTLGKYALAHAHSLFSNGFIAYKINELMGLPYIVAVRSTDVNVFFRRMPHLRALGIEVLRNASSIIFISETYRDYTLNHFIPKKYKEEFRGKSIVLPNGIDDFWHENRFVDRTPPDGKKLKVIYAGAVNSNKKVESTITACNLLRDEGYDIRFTVVGRMENRKYKRLFGKHPYIKYISHCAKEQLIGYYREADIFVMPSKHETFGLVYAEAMTQGLPVIYTRGQGFDGQFENGEVGFTVKHNDPQEIAQRVKHVLQDYNAISRRAVAHSQRYTWSEIAQQYAMIYEEHRLGK